MSKLSKFGRNVTAKCDTIHSKGSYLNLMNNVENLLENFDLRTHILSQFFLNENPQIILDSEQKFIMLQLQLLILRPTYFGKKLRILLIKSTSMFVATRA